MTKTTTKPDLTAVLNAIQKDDRLSSAEKTSLGNAVIAAYFAPSAN